MTRKRKKKKEFVPFNDYENVISHDHFIPEPPPVINTTNNLSRTEKTIEEIFNVSIKGVEETIVERRATKCWGSANKRKK